MTVTVFGYLILISKDFMILFINFLLSFSFDSKGILNSPDLTTFPNTSKFVVNTPLRVLFIFNSLLDVMQCGQTRCFVFDITAYSGVCASMNLEN